MTLPFEGPFTADRRQNRERRATARTAAEGALKISFQNPAPATIEAEWIESSATGFRAAHSSKALEPGLEVSYASPRGSGRARVIWTHVLDRHRVSGFLLL
jgi:hypothetical protein